MDLHKNMNQRPSEWRGELSAFWGLLRWAPSSSRKREVFCIGTLLWDETGYISAVLARRVKDATRNLISHALADPALH